MDLSESALLKYRANALQNISFRLVIDEADLQSSEDPNVKCTFKPLMAHQIFGESEEILGYEGLAINLLYHHNSSNCLLEIQYKSKMSVPCIEIDDIPKLLNEWLPKNYFTYKEDFRENIKKERNDQMFGTVIHEFKTNTEVCFLKNTNVMECTYKVTLINTSDELFHEYHERFETFIIWFIDAANFIDLKDERWMIFYIYEEFVMPETDKKIVTPIGFTAIYKFFSYPDSIRARISQFFILPTHQGKGLGTLFYQAVYNNILKEMPDITDLTVEEPNESFQKVRDYCDGLHIYKDLQANSDSLTIKNGKTLYSYFAKHKINKKQSLRIADILQYVKAIQSGPSEVNNYVESLFQRLKQQKKSECHIGKMARGFSKEQPQTEEIDEVALRQISKEYVSQLTPVAQKIVKTIEAY